MAAGDAGASAPEPLPSPSPSPATIARTSHSLSAGTAAGHAPDAPSAAGGAAAPGDATTAQAAAQGTAPAAAAPPGSSSDAGGPPEPYRLRAVGHSLGAMSLLMYVLACHRKGRPHHLSRLVLLTPAGFHIDIPGVAWLVVWWLPPLARGLRWAWRSFAWGFFIPTFFARLLAFKLVHDVHRHPSLAAVLRALASGLLGGDISQWDRALQMPHYNARDMPAVSLDQLLHVCQLVRARRFVAYDHGSAAANQREHGTPQPPDLAAQYWRLAGLPIDLVAGTRDGIIPPANVRAHKAAMEAAGLAPSYREFAFGHLDFTFAVKEELKMYMLRLLKKEVP